ncbi:uncharacterized protein LOC144103530 [Amblyomma americanum]
MERIEGFGDPHALLDTEDHIVLKLKDPWPRDASLPQGCSLGDDSGSLLVTNRESLVAARRALRRTPISEALFAGCVAFGTSHTFESAARKILRDCEEICIVHNRDTVYKLIRMFPNAKVLALPHDLGTHAVETDEPSRDPSAPLVRSSQLRQLVGSLEGQYDECLLLSTKTVRAILLTCPQLRRMDTFHFLEASVEQGCPAAQSEMSGCTHLVLIPSSAPYVLGGAVMATVDVISRAARTYQHVEHLVVAITCREELAGVSGFRNLRSLSLKIRPPLFSTNVDPELQLLLQSLPGLENLSLTFFTGLRLTAIARLCPQLKSLSLLDCEGPLDEVALGMHAFPSLEVVKLNVRLSVVCVGSLFLATSGRLRRLHLLGAGSSSKFLRLRKVVGGRLSFPRLEELTLNTDLTVRELGLEPEDLHHVMTALPALRRLKTDSYDVLRFQRNRFHLPWRQEVAYRVELAIAAMIIQQPASSSTSD